MSWQVSFFFIVFILVLDQSIGLGAQVIGHRHLYGAGQLGGLVKIVDHISGPQGCVC